MAEYDGRSALLVVDVQNDFADPDGALFVAGAGEAIARINTEIGRAHDAGALIVYTQDWHPEHTSHFEQDGGTWPVHCVAGTWGAILHGDLDEIDSAPQIRKGAGGEDGYSAFSVRDPRSGEVSTTELHALLQAQGIERTVVVGLATDYCVLQTVLDARRLDIDATVIEAAIRAVELQEGDGARALAAMREAGAHIE
ncbi:MAG: isochorismatase family protein [Chloroflexi bacterium]|nr:isochorismatase family protein [Chloroflexota bacterium]